MFFRKINKEVVNHLEKKIENQKAALLEHIYSLERRINTLSNYLLPLVKIDKKVLNAYLAFNGNEYLYKDYFLSFGYNNQLEIRVVFSDGTRKYYSYGDFLEFEKGYHKVKKQCKGGK